MTETFDAAFNIVLGHEKGLSLDPKDPGNWTGGKPGMGELKGTKYGISAKTFPDLDIRNLTEADARAIAKKHYWDICRCDDYPRSIALVVFDAAYNASPGKAVQWLQQSLRIQIDGIAGPMTVASVKRVKDVMPVLVDMLAFRTEYCRRLDNVKEHGLGWWRRFYKLAFQSIYFNP